MKKELDEIAESVEKVAKLGDEIFKSKLRDKAIIFLVAKASGVSQTNVEAVLNSLPELKAKFLKPE